MKPRLTPTSYALLGQLALRPWTTYELAREMHRNLRLFWPRAESRIYAEIKRLAARGLAKAKRDAVGSRPRTTYSITPRGRHSLRAWLRAPARGMSLEFESLLKVFFGRYGSPEDLVSALDRAQADAEAVLAVGAPIGPEYLQGRAPFQEHVHLRAFVFDFLWSYAQLVREWSMRTRAEVERWKDSSPTGKTERALEIIAHVMQMQPFP